MGRGGGRCFTSCTREAAPPTHFYRDDFDILKKWRRRRRILSGNGHWKKAFHFVSGFARIFEVTPLVYRLVRSVISIGVNYVEDNASESKEDFVHKYSISRKEAAETRYWLELAIFRGLGDKSAAIVLLDECEQPIRIFSSIVSRSKRWDS